MIVIPLIERKRDGGSLSSEEWRRIVLAYARDEVPDYQMAALLMAVLLNGLEPHELGALTDAMLESGAMLSLAESTPPRVDKHSTGGVGDKVSLVLAPLVASLGLAVPMISGRGLGHTGGTLDKLQAIPGFRVDLTLDEARAQVERLGLALIGQTGEIAPADRKLYALRDATATVDAIPLMAASIMSKRLAEGLNGLVLDIKRGSGAFLPELDDGLELARTMVGLGQERGCPTVALLTAMDRPLGVACGNALEVREAIDTLRGGGPDDLREVTLQLATEMVLLVGAADDRSAARHALERALDAGSALDRFRQVIEEQGGDPGVIDAPARLPTAPLVQPFASVAAGYVRIVEPRVIGQAVVAMGGGRQTMMDEIDPAVGIEVHVKPGDEVRAGTEVATIHATGTDAAAVARSALADAIVIAPEPAAPALPLVSHRVTSSGVEILG
jgi:pyrimidine-nucleoside phosphorylase